MIAHNVGHRFREKHANDDDIAPAGPAIACEQNTTVGNGVNGIAQIAVFPADAIEIVAKMMVFSKALGVVGEGAVLATQGGNRIE